MVIRYLRYSACPGLLKELEALAYVRLITDYPVSHQHGGDGFQIFPSENIPKARPRSWEVVFDAVSWSETSGPKGIADRRIRCGSTKPTGKSVRGLVFRMCAEKGQNV